MSDKLTLSDPLLNVKEGCILLGIAEPTWHKWVKRGLIPPPVKLGHLSRWPRSEVLSVIENAMAARTANTSSVAAGQETARTSKDLSLGQTAASTQPDF